MLDKPFLSNPPSAMVFDWDNTLVDSWNSIFLAFNKTLTAFGHEPWSEEFAIASIQRSGREAFPRLFGEQAIEAQQLFYRNISDDSYQGFRPLAEAENLLKILVSKRIPLGIVSNKSSFFLHGEVAHLGWGKYFGAVVGAGDAAQDKPAPDPLIMALEQLKVSPSVNVWMVGDAPVDWQCALAASCLPIAIGNRFDAAPYTEWTFKDCDALKKIFGQM